MNHAELVLTPDVYGSLTTHLLPTGNKCEEAAFGFANARTENGRLVFELIELLPVPPEGFVEKSRYFLHLTDEMRALVIKRAHDLKASLVEFHSHPLQRHAEFSPSDLAGFREFVPHILWRLKGRPYAAFVFAPTGFDAVAWMDDVQNPVAFGSVVAGGDRHIPTNATIQNWRLQ
jgi:hypothetical protein